MALWEFLVAKTLLWTAWMCMGIQFDGLRYFSCTTFWFEFNASHKSLLNWWIYLNTSKSYFKIWKQLYWRHRVAYYFNSEHKLQLICTKLLHRSKKVLTALKIYFFMINYKIANAMQCKLWPWKKTRIHKCIFQKPQRLNLSAAHAFNKNLSVWSNNWI